MSKYIALSIAIALLLFSCERESKSAIVNRSLPVLIKLSGYIVPSDSILPPDTITIKIPTGIIAKESQASVLKTNQSVIPLSLKISKMSTTMRIIGEEETDLPKLITFEERRVITGVPKQVFVKEPLYKEINPGSFFYFSKGQGLLHDQIRALAQDTIGNIWIGTDRGLSRYDGKYFYHFTSNEGLPESLINALFIDSHQNLWISTYGKGVTKYDGKYFTNISTVDGLPHDLVNCIFEDKNGTIWFGTRKGLVKYDTGRLTVFTTSNGLSANDVRSIIEDNTGRMWLATYGGGISIFDGESFSTFSTKEGLIQDHISLLFVDSKMNIWISTAYMGIIKYDGRSLISYTTREGLGNNSIRSILEDRDGNMWFGNSNGNITKFDGSSMRVYGKSDGLVAEAMRSSLQDKNGNLWFGTRGSGLVRFEGRLFTHYTEQDGLSSSRISSISEDPYGKLWFGTYGGGINVLTERITNGVKRQYITPFTTDSGNKGKFVTSILEDNIGNLWVSTDNKGLVKYDGKKIYTYDKSIGLLDNMVINVNKDNSNNIWFSSARLGVSVIKGNKVITYSSKNGLSSNHIRSTLQDSRNNYWFGTSGGGVTKYDGKNFIHVNKKNGFFTDTINSIIEDNRGIIWMATHGEGVIRYDGETFIRYSEESGLKSNLALSILQDSKGNIWIGTRYGLHEIKKRVHEAIDSSRRSITINSYGIDEGFFGLECRKNAIAESKNGTIWIGTEDRLTAYHGGTTYGDDYSPSLQITKLQLFNEDVPWEKLYSNPDSTVIIGNGIKINGVRMSAISNWYALPQNLILSHRNNYITIHFIATTHTQIKSVRYQYKLEGLEKNWSTLSDKTEASYGNLKHGKYIFRVKSITGEGVESTESTFAFTIKPFFWETIYFRLGIIILIILLSYFFIKTRIRKANLKATLLDSEVLSLRKQLLLEEQESTIAKEERDKLFSIITHDFRRSINSFADASKSLSEVVTELEGKELKTISDKINSSWTKLTNMLDNVHQWSRIQQHKTIFNPEKIVINEIIQDDLRILTQIANEKEITITHSIPTLLKIDSDPRMFRIIMRNIISNAIKFTPRGGDIIIKIIGRKSNSVEITIEDTGIGMSEEIKHSLFDLNKETERYGTEGEPGTGLGLMICHSLVKQHLGSISVESEIKKGTKLIIILPKKQAIGVQQ